MRFWSLDPLIVASRLIARDPNHTFRANRRTNEKRVQYELFRGCSRRFRLRRIVKLRFFASRAPREHGSWNFVSRPVHSTNLDLTSADGIWQTSVRPNHWYRWRTMKR